jgi:hypothetical protein
MNLPKKKKVKLLTDKNALVKELKEVEWIKNPFIYSQIRGDFTLIQTQIMISIVSKLQDKVNEYINYKSGTYQLELPFVGDAREGEVEFLIKLSDLGIRKDMYRDLEDACEKLLKMIVSYTKVESSGREYMVMANIFSRIEIPKDQVKSDDTEMQFKNKERRSGLLKVYMLKNNFMEVFDMRKGYVEHIKKIVPLCRKKRTPRLYIYLSRWKDVGHKLVDYNELKEYLGVLSLDAKRTKIQEDQYPLYSLFASKVLDVVKAEMDALATMNEIDFTFSYVPKYNDGRKRGNPDGILFNITLSDIGMQKKRKAALDKTSNTSQKLLKEEYKLTDADVFSLYSGLTPEQVPLVNAEVFNLRDRLQTIKMNNPKLYVIQSMRNYIETIRPMVCEIEDATEKESGEDNHLTEDDKQMWDGFMKLVKDTVDKIEFDTFWAYTDIKSADDKTITISVPTKFVAEHIFKSISGRVNICWMSVFGEGVKVLFDIKEKY